MIIIWALALSLSLLVAIVIGEYLFPMLPRDISAEGKRRRMTNRLLSALNAVMVMLGMAALAWGAGKVTGNQALLPIPGPAWLVLVVHMLLLDFGVYWAHRLLHTVPSLWALHQIHHSDGVLDITSIGRGHPLEVLIGFACVLPVVVVFGISAEHAVLYQVWLNTVFLFAHANVAIPPKLERALAAIIQTPNLHAVHHRPVRTDADSMYGLTLTLWDRLCGTYNPAMREGEEPLGVAGYSKGKGANYSLRELLLWPLGDPKRNK